MTLRHVLAVLGASLIAASGSAAFAQVQMPNAREMSGTVLEVTDIPAGTLTVRVVRGGPGNNISGQVVEFVVDGKRRTATTDKEGRATLSGLPKGTTVKAVATVDGERLESKDALIANSGLRIMLVATDPEATKREEEDRRLAAGPAVKGVVVLGPESRVIAEMSGDRLSIYYIMQVVNSARTPVDIGGPLVFELPREARGTTVLDGSTPAATANGARITVLGPFAPGVTTVQGAYELPYSGGTAYLDQSWPAALEQLTVMVQQLGGMAIESPQLTAKQDINDQGQTLILGTGPGLAAGQSLKLAISGLPHRPVWPRNLALAMAGAIMAAGLWGAFTAVPRRRAA